MQANAKYITESIKLKPVTDKDLMDFLSLNRNDFSDYSYGLLRQWLVHNCIRHNIDWAFMRLCCADTVNSGPLPDGTTCLVTAVEYRRSLCVRHILHKYVAPDDTWNRARNVATEKKHEEIVELIQSRQRDLQKNKMMGRNRLHLAVIEGDLDMVEHVLNKNLVDHSEANQDGDTPLMMAVANGMDECADVIRQHGADVNVVNKHGRTVLHAAVSGKMNALPQWLIGGCHRVEQRDCMNLTALQQAVVADLESMAAQLVAIGADHRSVIRDNSASFYMRKCQLALTRQDNVASLCLKIHGRLYPSLLDAFNLDDVNFSDANGDSLLHLTSRLANAEGCTKLLSRGANVSSRNNMGRTPLVELLHLVERRDMNIGDDIIATVGCLVEQGADIEDEDGTGRTALQICIGLVAVGVERLMLEMVKKCQPISKLSVDDLTDCVHRKFCRFLEAIVPLIEKPLSEELVTEDLVRQSMPTLQPSTTRTLFMHAGVAVQDALVDEMLRYAACNEDEEYFKYLLQRHNANWTIMADGETILTALLKETNLKFCRLLLNMRSTSRLVQLANQNGDSALMVAIEKGIDEVMDELIIETKGLDSQNDNGLSVLSLLFQQVSETHSERQARLSIWIRHLIAKDANIYSVNKNGQTAISFCTNGALKSDFELFFNRQHPEEIRERRGAVAAPQQQPLVEPIVCTVCVDRPINCSLRCGHTFCMDCVEVLYECPYCRATDMTATRIFLN